MAIGKEILGLESAIGYHFADISYLEKAVTHSSYTNEQRTRGIAATSNERLEFLGDAVLQMVISEYLYKNFKKHREGALTKLRQKLVCEGTLSKIAQTISLGDYLNLGNGEELNGCRMRPKVLADAFEALIAAVYLDSSSSSKQTYKNVVLNLFSDEIAAASRAQNTDYKTMLQQLVEQDGTSELEYKLIGESGPEHDKIFTVAAIINNNEVGRGSAAKRQKAEMLAAKMALRLFGVTV